VIAEYGGAPVSTDYALLLGVPPVVLAEPLPIELVGEVSGEVVELGDEKLLRELGLLKPP